MWTREGLKNNTKAMLKVHYWKIWLVIIAYIFISSSASSIISFVSLPFTMAGSFLSTGFQEDNFSEFTDDFEYSEDNSYSEDDYSDYNFEEDFPSVEELFSIIAPALIFFLFFFLITIIVSFAISIFLILPISVGVQKTILNSFLNKSDFSDIGFAFKNRQYMAIVKTMALMSLYLFLWFMLFYIPGIVKFYSYRMVPYILTDNPNIGAKRAIELSRRMTDGEKADMFVLDLSFIGWYLLGLLACGFGVIFVVPYHQATFANLYMVLRDKAIVTGLTSYEELGFARPDASAPQGFQGQGFQGQYFYNQGVAPQNFYPGMGAPYQPPVNPYIWPQNGQPPYQGGQPMPPQGQQPPVPPEPPIPPAPPVPTVTEPESTEAPSADTENPEDSKPSFEKPEYTRSDFEQKDE